MVKIKKITHQKGKIEGEEYIVIHTSNNLTSSDRKYLLKNDFTMYQGDLWAIKYSDVALNILIERGANITSSVSKNTDTVLAGSGTENGSKLSKAKELGIRVVNERELAKMIEEARTHSFETIKFLVIGNFLFTFP